ncbi:MAG: ATP-dependent helicase, partial [Deltaproteobacteria bacterium]
ETEGTILVVSDRVAHCQKLAKLLAEKGVQASILTGKQPTSERSAIVEAVHRGEVKVLVSTLQLVGEGFDAAGLTTLFLTTPIKFTGRLRQVIGRILRPASGKQPKVIDYVDEHVGVLKNSARIRYQAYESESDAG